MFYNQKEGPPWIFMRLSGLVLAVPYLITMAPLEIFPDRCQTLRVAFWLLRLAAVGGETLCNTDLAL
jgi:hypothetical protein